MKTNHSVNVALLLFLALNTSCHKNNASPNLVDLPVSVGTNWKYVVYDSIHGNTDTQTVAITGTAIMSDGRTAKTVRSYFSFSTDTSYTYLVENTDKATFYTNQNGIDYNKSYTYPLKVGAWWRGENILDTNKVVSNIDIGVPAGSFSTYMINRSYKVTGMAVRENEWYCPGVGMVQRNYYERNIGFIINKTFRLVSYSIAR